MRAEGEPADALTLRLTVDQFQGRFANLVIVVTIGLLGLLSMYLSSQQHKDARVVSYHWNS